MAAATVERPPTLRPAPSVLYAIDGQVLLNTSQLLLGYKNQAEC
jgi:hypothetical protein